MIVDYGELPNIREQTQAQGQTIAVRFGCYDLLHKGHIEGIDFAAERADLLAIGIAPDEKVRQRKGPDRPIQHEDIRQANVDEVEPVDFSFIMPLQPLAVFRSLLTLRPDYFVESTEYSKYRHGASAVLKRLGIGYVPDPTPNSQSTTELVRLLRLADEPGVRGRSVSP